MTIFVHLALSLCVSQRHVNFGAQDEHSGYLSLF